MLPLLLCERPNSDLKEKSSMKKYPNDQLNHQAHLLSEFSEKPHNNSKIHIDDVEKDFSKSVNNKAFELRMVFKVFFRI